MPKLYGEMVADNKMKVTMISWSGNKPGGIEVEEVPEGEGNQYVDPTTGRQWFETEGEESAITKLQEKMDELSAMIESLKGDQDGLGD
jgi:succinyl-CoA synthetase beta subunit